MNKRPGYFRLARVGGTDLLVHWSVLIGGAIVAACGNTDPGQWAELCLAYLFLLIIHEAGHVLAAVALRLKVFTIEISGLGGLCRIERARRVRHSVLVYAAGLLAQVVVFSATLVYINGGGTPVTPFGGAIEFTFTVVNVYLFVINLIPFHDTRSGFATDGAILWQLFLHKFRGHPHPHPLPAPKSADQSPVFPPETRLLDKPGFRPPDFVQGIEILNDQTTPMEFVVNTLMTHLKLTQSEAIVKMLHIHNTGGLLIPLPSAQEAHTIAAAVSAQAQAAGHSFVCRYAGEGARAD